MARYVLLFSVSTKRGAAFAATKRRLSSSALTATIEDIAAKTAQGLLHPDMFCNGTIPYPKSLSPSSIMEFKKCPQSFLFQYLWGLKQPTNKALAKGSVCHDALEKIFDLPPQERSLENLQNFFRSEWSNRRMTASYRHLFEHVRDDDTPEWDVHDEREWGKSGLQLLQNYYNVEDPTTVVRPNPIRRELWVRANLTTPQKDMFLVRGIVDRLDMARNGDNDVVLRIVDYKTGKAPHLKYDRATNDRIVDEAFYQLKIYALLLRENGGGLDPRLLRLLYLTSPDGRGRILDMDLGPDRDAVLEEIHQDLSKVWTDIHALVSQQDPMAFVGCDRPYCYCHTCRPRFAPDTVWEPK